MSKTKRHGKWAMTDNELQSWLKINKPKTIQSAKIYKRKPKYKEW